MNYESGQIVKIGDVVIVSREWLGKVVCDVDGDCYNDGYPRAEWAQVLGRGVLILTDKVGLVHMEEPDEDLELIAREDGNPIGAE